MILVRALNNLDIAADPVENGIASKKIIYELTKKYYSSNSKEFNSLNDLEKDLFIKEHMIEYVSTHRSKLNKMFLRESLASREDGKEYLRTLKFIEEMKKNNIELTNDVIPKDIDIGIYIKIYKYLSTLQSHLVFGNSNITDWVSTSKSFEKNQKYRDNQDIHKIALIYNHYETFINPRGVMIVDLSTQENILKQDFLCNKFEGLSDKELDDIADRCRHDIDLFKKYEKEIVRKTKPNCRGFSYSKSSDEVCINKYVPKEYVLDVLDGIQLDLFLDGLVDYRFYLLNKKEKAKELVKFKNTLLYLIKKSNNPSLLFTYDELYNKDKNIMNIDEDKDKLEHNKKLILKKAGSIISPLIRR